MSEWQPIETAPKDGTRILVYPSTWGGGTASIAFWNDDKYAKRPRPFWSREDDFGRITKLRLDDGQVAWGCEIWWEREAYVKTLEEGRQIVKPKLESLRAHARKLWKEANAKLDTDEEALP